MTLLAVLAGVAAVLGFRPVADRRLRVIDAARSASAPRGRWLQWAVSAIAIVPIAAFGGPSVAGWVVLGVALVGTLAHTLRSRRLKRQANRVRAEVVHACQVLAGQLRIGQVPSVALRAAAGECVLLERPAATQSIGGDVATALLEVAGRESGASGLIWLSRAWRISERTGAPIAGAATAVAAALRSEAETASVVTRELAGARASGRLLACLPAVGVALGSAAGGQPIQFLTGSWLGEICLVAGVLLACAGVVWTERLADSIEAG